VRKAVISAPRHVAAVEADPSPLADGQVRIAVTACGICGSDLHTFDGHHPFVTYPVYPGHELAGLVVDVGPGVPATWAGRRVVIEPSVVCGVCENCRAGRYNICERLRVMGFQLPGGMAEQFTVSADRLLALPATMTDDQGALVEPLAVAIHAARLPRSLIARDVVVLGAGTIGLLAGQVVRAYGARRVVLTDPLPARRAAAAQVGLHAVAPPGDGAQVVSEEYFAGRRPDAIVECVGAEATLRQAIEWVRKGGEVIVVGVFGRDALVPAGLIQDREIVVRGSLMYVRSDFEEAVRLIGEGHVRVDPLVSHRLPLEAVGEAFRIAGSRAAALKVLVTP
jgi:L-iditol 2-dehydrogenase